MSEASTIEALRGALKPVEDLRCEHSQLACWVNDSFASLERLHAELAEMRNYLIAKESDLELRTAEFDRRRLEWEAAQGSVKKSDADAEVETDRLREQLESHRALIEELEQGQALHTPSPEESRAEAYTGDMERRAQARRVAMSLRATGEEQGA
ncbi:MAG: hypothetical protein AAF961_06445 [Planctomycetota bacterium]